MHCRVIISRFQGNSPRKVTKSRKFQPPKYYRQTKKEEVKYKEKYCLVQLAEISFVSVHSELFSGRDPES